MADEFEVDEFLDIDEETDEEIGPDEEELDDEDEEEGGEDEEEL